VETPSPTPPEPAPGEVPEPPTASPEGAALEGTVLDAESGAPVAGARVWIIEGGTVDGFSMLKADADDNPCGEGLTGDDGLFRFEGLPSGEILTVRASAAGRSLASESLRLDAASLTTRSLTLRLGPAGSIYGVVLHTDGRPVPGANVYAIPADHADMVAMPDATRSVDGGTITPAKTVSGEDGSWRIEGLELDASWIVLAVLPGFGRSEPIADQVCSLAVREVPCNPVLRKDGILRVRVLQPDGSPLAGAPVMYFGGGFPVISEADAEGLSTFLITTTGQCEVRALPTGFLPMHRKVDVEAFVDLDLELLLSKGVTLAGVLVDDGGNPIPGQTLIVDRHWADRGLDPSEGRTTTDDSGRFRLDGMGEGPHRVGLVLAAHHLDDDYRVHAPDENARIVAPRMARLRAVLVPPKGHDLPSDAEDIEVWEDRGVAGGSHGSMLRATLEGGVLRAGSFPAGRCNISILIPGFLSVARAIVAAPGVEFDLGTIALEVGDEIAGRVADAPGRPVAGATISTAFSMRHSQTSKETAADGTFVLKHQPKEPVDLEIEAEGFLPWTGTAVAGVRVEVVLLRGALLRGVLRKSDGTPSAGRRIEVKDLIPETTDQEIYETHHWTVESDASGRWSIRVPAGRYDVMTWVEVKVEGTEQFETAEAHTIEVVEGEEREMDLVNDSKE
jgi:protocatechuate 3,4-dioxygenase beta subunit